MTRVTTNRMPSSSRLSAGAGTNGVQQPRTSRRKSCEHSSCLKQPAFGFNGSGVRFCAQHRHHGMVNVRNRRCEGPDCTKEPYFGEGGGKARFCATHKPSEDMVDVRHRRCEFVSCDKQPNYGFEGERACFCSTHKLPTMVDVKHRRCAQAGCRAFSAFSFPGSKEKYCSQHRRDGMMPSGRGRSVAARQAASATRSDRQIGGARKSGSKAGAQSTAPAVSASAGRRLRGGMDAEKLTSIDVEVNAGGSFSKSEGVDNLPERGIKRHSSEGSRSVKRPIVTPLEASTDRRRRGSCPAEFKTTVHDIREYQDSTSEHAGAEAGDMAERDRFVSENHRRLGSAHLSTSRPTKSWSWGALPQEMYGEGGRSPGSAARVPPMMHHSLGFRNRVDVDMADNSGRDRYDGSDISGGGSALGSDARGGGYSAALPALPPGAGGGGLPHVGFRGAGLENSGAGAPVPAGGGGGTWADDALVSRQLPSVERSPLQQSTILSPPLPSPWRKSLPSPAVPNSRGIYSLNGRDVGFDWSGAHATSSPRRDAWHGPTVSMHGLNNRSDRERGGFTHDFELTTRRAQSDGDDTSVVMLNCPEKRVVKYVKGRGALGPTLETLETVERLENRWDMQSQRPS